MLLSLSVHLGPLSIVSSILICGPVFGVHYNSLMTDNAKDYPMPELKLNKYPQEKAA
jgi:hypothetical protein